jgi:hypothetical protein
MLMQETGIAKWVQIPPVLIGLNIKKKGIEPPVRSAQYERTKERRKGWKTISESWLLP